MSSPTRQHWSNLIKLPSIHAFSLRFVPFLIEPSLWSGAYCVLPVLSGFRWQRHACSTQPEKPGNWWRQNKYSDNCLYKKFLIGLSIHWLLSFYTSKDWYPGIQASSDRQKPRASISIQVDGWVGGVRYGAPYSANDITSGWKLAGDQFGGNNLGCTEQHTQI